jgi:hypothetical protein
MSAPIVNNTNLKAKTQTQKRKAGVEAYKAFSHYLAIRRSYYKGQATIEQLAHALALLDLALVIAGLKQCKK